MSGEVLYLRPQLPEGLTPEHALLAAVFASPEKLELMEAMGCAREDFQNPRMNIAWSIATRLAGMRLEVSPLTICSAGTRIGMLAPADMIWLVELLEYPALTREQALQVAEDVRAMARARRVRSELQQAIDTIDRGRFNPARLGAELESITMGLATDFGVDESAEGELLALNEQWASNAEKGKLTVDPTGIRLLDDIIGGTPENLTIIQGLRGAGKDILASTMIRAQLERDKDSAEPSKTGVFWLEDGTQALLRRWQAEDLGLLMREIGSKQLTPEQWERKHHIDAHHFALLRRIVHYRHDRISRAELRRRATRMIFKDKVRRIYINNMKEIDHSGQRQRPDQNWELLAETTRVIRNLARDAGVPVVLMIHDTEEAAKDGHEHAPDPGRMTGGQTAGDRARLVLGVWRKGHSLRVTVTKGNEISDAGVKGPTIELQRNFEAGTANPQGGRVLDLRAEEAKDRREQKANALVESVEMTEQRKALLAKRAAELKAEEPPKPKESPAQASLLDVPQSTKPEGGAP